ncbi:MAG: HesA/MoeB/ThiF family protein [Bacteroidales bacterium]
MNIQKEQQELLKERYDRHLQLSQIGEAGQEKLRKASVLLVGVGGLGSPIALYLAASGIGRIGLVDDDCVSLSNLQRQVLYQEREIGLLKVVCAKKRLLQSNSFLQVDTYPVRLNEENAESIISGYDIIIDGCDNFQTRYLIDTWSSKLKIPYVYGSISEFEGQVSVFNYNGGGKYSDLFPEHSCLEMPKGVLGVVPGVIGTLQACEAIKIITGVGESLVNRLLVANLLTMEFYVVAM